MQMIQWRAWRENLRRESDWAIVEILIQFYLNWAPPYAVFFLYIWPSSRRSHTRWPKTFGQYLNNIDISDLVDCYAIKSYISNVPHCKMFTTEQRLFLLKDYAQVVLDFAEKFANVPTRQYRWKFTKKFDQKGSVWSH